MAGGPSRAAAGKQRHIIDEKLPSLVSICRQNGVNRLDLFGSAARDEFEPTSSDLDFLVSFQDSESRAILDSYFNTLRRLEELFGRKVDLVMADSVTNPFLQESLDRDRIMLCERRGGRVMAKNPKVFLHDAAMALAAISRYTAGKTLEDYQRDDMLQAAVERRFEIAAEALNQLSKSYPSVASRIAELGAVVGFRNILAHDYSVVSNRIVWELAQTKAPALLKEIESILQEQSATASAGTKHEPEDDGGCTP